MVRAAHRDVAIRKISQRELMEPFCGSNLWDLSLTWYTDNPDVTPCFQKTILVWVPCAFLWILAPLEIYYLKQKRGKYIPWTLLNIFKMVILLGLIGLTLSEIVFSMMKYLDDDLVYPVEYYTPFIECLTFIMVFILVYAGKSKGAHTSGVLFIFWFLLSLGMLVKYRSLLLRVFNDAYVQDPELETEFIYTMFYFPFILSEFFLSCMADSKPISYLEVDKIENECPETSASFLSRLLFWWFNGLAALGYRTSLQMKDMWPLDKSYRTDGITETFDRYWEKEKQKHGEFKVILEQDGKEVVESKVNLMVPLLKTFFGDLCVTAFVKFIASLMTFVSPLVLDLLIAYVSTTEPLWKGLLYAFLMFFSAMIESILNSQYEYSIYIIGMKMRSAMISAIYRKALLLSSSAKHNYTTGEIVNLMSVDTQRVMDYIHMCNLLWVTPLQIGLSVYLLWQQLGLATLGGVGVMILLMPINGVVTVYIRNYQVKLMRDKDKRIKLMNEILGGVKVLKLYAWENSFLERINSIRDMELNSLKIQAYLSGAITFAFTSAPFLVAIVSFAVYILMDSSNVLDANIAFVSLSLFNILRIPMAFLPMLITFTAMFLVSLGRINKYLRSDELDPEAVEHDPSEEDPVVVKNGTFAWAKSSQPVIKKINLNVKKGALAAVVGSVGSGKSSILSALLGDMEKHEGRVNIQGSLAYTAQQAWIQNATLKDNILFGKADNSAQYENVLEVCALKPDLAVLPGGDQTEIGEKGINLSGGQKQRVSIARAVYSNADIYFFDDPLSAVDSHVGKHIFDKVLGPKGVLKNKTRILVTHRLSVLPQCDVIFVMKDGTISEVGSYSELVAKRGAFADFLLQFLQQGGDELDAVSEEDLHLVEEIVATVGGTPELLRTLSRISGNESDSYTSDGERFRKSRHSSLVSGKISRSSSVIAERRLSSAQLEQKKKKGPKGSRLTEDETAEVGSVKWSVYLEYIKALGHWMTFITLASFILSHAFNIGGSIWLSEWSNDSLYPELLNDTALRNLRLGVYGGLGGAETIFILVASISLNLAALRGGLILHKDMLFQILRAPMSFFDTTPMGRILNRFSKDIDTVDITIRFNLRMLILQFFRTIVALILISLQTPIFLLAVLPLGGIYYFVQKFYIATSRQLKRLESVSRSPIYVHFSETVTGSSSIRAYGAAKSFIGTSNSLTDTNNSSYFPSLAASRWLAIRLEFLGYTIVFLAALFAVLTRETLTPGLAGLSVSYALTITATLNMLVRATSDVETNLVSVERCLEYAKVETEAAWHNEDSQPDSKWPLSGNIQFDNYSTRYRKELELVLKGVNCDIKPGEKVGVVGRTGAGKSSLTLALFRIIEAAGGNIMIDGLDISKLGLYDLRSRLTIIPQDPVLFSGSLRINFDPFDKYSDHEIWTAIEHAHLKEFIQTLPKRLQHEVAEGGENLSIGQRQLVCLARALLRKTKILILDEATAAVDMETDELIQTTIRKEFSDCTIVTIAHRLNTVMDYDRIMVLDAGNIVEYDSPAELLKDDKSVFYSLARDAGLV